MKWLYVMTYFQLNINQPICQCLLNANFRTIFHLLHKQMMELKKKRFGLATLQCGHLNRFTKNTITPKIEMNLLIYFFRMRERERGKKSRFQRDRNQHSFDIQFFFFKTPKKKTPTHIFYSEPIYYIPFE